MIENIEELLTNINTLTSQERVDLLKKALTSISLSEWFTLGEKLKEEYSFLNNVTTVSESESDSSNETKAAVEHTSLYLKSIPEGLQKCFPIFKYLAQIKGSDLLTVRNDLSTAFDNDSAESYEKRLIKRDISVSEIDSLQAEFESYGATVERK